MEGFADRGYGLCDDAAMVEDLKGQYIGAWSGSESAGPPIGRSSGGGRSRNMQTGVLAGSALFHKERKGGQRRVFRFLFPGISDACDRSSSRPITLPSLTLPSSFEEYSLGPRALGALL